MRLKSSWKVNRMAPLLFGIPPLIIICLVWASTGTNKTRVCKVYENCPWMFKKNFWHLRNVSFCSNGKTLHTRIEYRNGQFCFYMSPDADSFNTVAELIQHCIAYSEVGIFCYSKPRRSNNASMSYPVRLTKPISRFTEVNISFLTVMSRIKYIFILHYFYIHVNIFHPLIPGEITSIPKSSSDSSKRSFWPDSTTSSSI